jgi:chitinase
MHEHNPEIRILVSLGGQFFTVNWTSFDPTKIIEIVEEYGFDGIDLDFEGGSIPTAELADTVATKIKSLKAHFQENDSGFMLTSAPEWPYVTPFTYGNGASGSHSFANQNFLAFFSKVGIENFDYIWPQSYNQGPSNGLTGPSMLKVVPSSGMGEFMASLCWATCTDAGYAVNAGKAGQKYDFRIPCEKLVIGIPAAEGAAGGELAYVPDSAQIKQAYTKMTANQAQCAGFMTWSADFDIMDLPAGYLSPGYSHAPWETVKAIRNP